jgi:hypothetical protein
VITVPNAEFSQMQIVNFTRRDQMLYRITIGLRYETTPDQLRHVMAGIREMLIRHERVSPDPARVRLLGFGPSSLDVEIFAYVSVSDYDAYLGVREDLNLRIMEIVAASGTGFAFLSQTVYLGRDRGIHLERGQQAARRSSAGAAKAACRSPSSPRRNVPGCRTRCPFRRQGRHMRAWRRSRSAEMAGRQLLSSARVRQGRHDPSGWRHAPATPALWCRGTDARPP